MGVSKNNRGTPKWMVYNGKLIWGYHYFRKHPYDYQQLSWRALHVHEWENFLHFAGQRGKPCKAQWQTQLIPQILFLKTGTWKSKVENMQNRLTTLGFDSHSN